MLTPKSTNYCSFLFFIISHFNLTGSFKPIPANWLYYYYILRLILAPILTLEDQFFRRHNPAIYDQIPTFFDNTHYLKP